jgi:hypothetical protein
MINFLKKRNFSPKKNFNSLFFKRNGLSSLRQFRIAERREEKKKENLIFFLFLSFFKRFFLNLLKFLKNPLKKKCPL